MNFLKVWKLRIHWQIVLAILVGVGGGLLIQQADPRPTLGITVAEEGGILRVKSIQKGTAPEGIRAGDRILAVEGAAVKSAKDFDKALAPRNVADVVVVTLDRSGESTRVSATVKMSADSARARALEPFNFLAELFMRCLQMLIVPLILTSIISGVTSVGNLGALGRMGLKTLIFYVMTSLLAILVGLCLVNAIQPGWNADISLTQAVSAEDLAGDESFVGIFLRMVPKNVFQAFSSNGSILQVIVFALLFGVFITRLGGEHADLLKKFFDAAFEVMMKIAEFILMFIPLGVVALIARVVGASGLGVFIPLFWLMLTVVGALAIHAALTLPLILSLIGKVNPLRWARAVSPALLTAFSTSSSSVTLPVTLRSVVKRGGVSNRTASFTLPLGATVNMDGTALYECVGVLFLAQYYASTTGFELTLGKQIIVVITALLASIGAAGIPSAGLVMMTTILSVLKLPLEGVMLLLAIDRPLDMLRTAVNNWSDSTCAAVIARSEGETFTPGEEEDEGGESEP